MKTEVKERPILFNSEMVRAILAGKKTQTRRPIKPQPKRVGGEMRFGWSSVFDNGIVHTWNKDGVGGENWNAKLYPEENAVNEALKRAINQEFFVPPLGKPGDRLWVRETFVEMGPKRPLGYFQDPEWINRNHFYKADNNRPMWAPQKWKPSIHMPREASRITLEITNVRAERLKDMSMGDCAAEGVQLEDNDDPLHSYFFQFNKLWDSIYGKDFPSESDPWFWVYEFKVLEQSEVE